MSDYNWSKPRAIDIPPRKDIFDWIKKNYPEERLYRYIGRHVSTHQMCYMADFINNEKPYKSYCNNYASWSVTNPDHPEWPAVYHCDEHIKHLPDHLVKERLRV